MICRGSSILLACVWCLSGQPAPSVPPQVGVIDSGAVVFAYYRDGNPSANQDLEALTQLRQTEMAGGNVSRALLVDMEISDVRRLASATRIDAQVYEILRRRTQCCATQILRRLASAMASASQAAGVSVIVAEPVYVAPNVPTRDVTVFALQAMGAGAETERLAAELRRYRAEGAQPEPGEKR